MTSGPIPAGSPREIASAERGARATAALSQVRRLAELDHGVAAKVTQVAPRAAVDPLLVELAVDLVVAGGRRVHFVTAAKDQRPDAFIERTERLRRLADLHVHHHLLQCGRQVAHLDAVLLNDLTVEFGRDLLRAAAAADGARCLGKA